jgi:hypothetical protein
MRNNCFLFIPFIFLFSMTPGKQISKAELFAKHSLNSKTVLLEYLGSLTGPGANFKIGAQIQMDSSIGFRYDVTFQTGTKVLSHIAIFYKFSSPYQTIYYNYLNHKSQVIKGGGSAKDPDMAVVGIEKIDSFTCTHLYKGNDNEKQHYWMSTAVPGFFQLVNKMYSIDPGLELMAINQTIFNWGGLVRLNTTSNTNGKITSFTLNLVEAQTGLIFPPSDFNVPTK